MFEIHLPSIHRGDRIAVISQTFGEPFVETGTFEYATEGHIYIRSDDGLLMGVPKYFMLGIAPIADETPDTYKRRERGHKPRFEVV